MDARKVALLISVVLLASGIVAIAQMSDRPEPDKPTWSTNNGTTKTPGVGSDTGTKTPGLQSDISAQCKQLDTQLKSQMQEIKNAESSLQAAVSKLDTAGDDKAQIAALTDAVKAINKQHQALGKVLETHKQIIAHECGHMMQGMDAATRQQMNGCPLMQDSLKSDTGVKDYKSDTGIKSDADKIKSDADKMKSDAEKIKSDAEKKADDTKSDWQYSPK